MVRRLTRDEIVKKFRDVHGDDRYNYSNVEYVNNHTCVSIICNAHGVFQQSPVSHLRGNGCSVCSGKKPHTTEEIIETFKKIYGDDYDYSMMEYKGALVKFKVLCKTHGEFETLYNNMQRGWACPGCTNYRKNIEQSFLKEAREVHGDEYDYSKVVYKNSHTNIEIICKTHGSFFQSPRIHTSGSGCQKCARFTTSKIARNWLSSLNIPNLRTFDSPLGEFTLPETRWRVDGYDENTKTIYEFHGDYWHAHPSNKRYSKDEQHPRKKGTWGEVYEKTLAREQKIRDLGYNLVVIWEHEFLASLDCRRDRISLYTS
jgi:hypothetical protein